MSKTLAPDPTFLYISRLSTLAPVAINLLGSHPADRPHMCLPADTSASTTCRIHSPCCRRLGGPELPSSALPS